MVCRFAAAARRGLTLIELVVVIAILAVLAMIVVPKLDGLQNNANHAAAANSVSDLGRYIQTYRTTKQRFPDGWDSLASGTSLWQVADLGAKTKGLHPTAFASGGKFAEYKLTGADVAGLKAVGITTLYKANTTLTSKRPGDMFTDGTANNIASDAAVAKVISTSIIDHVYRANLKTGGTSGAVPSDRTLIALGFGPQNELVGSLMLEAPSYANVDSSLIYNRHLALFEVGGSKALFKGVVAADGDLLDDLTTYINRDIQ